MIRVTISSENESLLQKGNSGNKNEQTNFMDMLLSMGDTEKSKITGASSEKIEQGNQKSDDDKAIFLAMSSEIMPALMVPGMVLPDKVPTDKVSTYKVPTDKVSTDKVSDEMTLPGIQSTKMRDPVDTESQSDKRLISGLSPPNNAVYNAFKDLENVQTPDRITDPIMQSVNQQELLNGQVMHKSEGSISEKPAFQQSVISEIPDATLLEKPKQPEPFLVYDTRYQANRFNSQDDVPLIRSNALDGIFEKNPMQNGFENVQSVDVRNLKEQIPKEQVAAVQFSMKQVPLEKSPQEQVSVVQTPQDQIPKGQVQTEPMEKVQKDPTLLEQISPKLILKNEIPEEQVFAEQNRKVQQSVYNPYLYQRIRTVETSEGKVILNQNRQFSIQQNTPIQKIDPTGLETMNDKIHIKSTVDKSVNIDNQLNQQATFPFDGKETIPADITMKNAENQMLSEQSTGLGKEEKVFLNFNASLQKKAEKSDKDITTYAQQNSKSLFDDRPFVHMNEKPSEFKVKLDDMPIQNEIADKLVLATKEGIREINITLLPEKLGKIALHVIADKDGISAKIITDNLQVKNELAQQSITLTDALKEKGYSVNHIEVHYKGSADGSNQFTGREGQRQSQQYEQKNQQHKSYPQKDFSETADKYLGNLAETEGMNYFV